MTLFTILETRGESGQGSKKGREKYTAPKDSPKKKGAVKAKKARVRIYSTIADALRLGKVGDMFSTKGADRVYVISMSDWGSKSKGKIAKGFTPGSSTPSSDFKSMKAHSVRTMLKHGATKSDRLDKLYGPGAKDKIKNSKKAAVKKGE